MTEVSLFLKQHGLKPHHVYLLELIPLIKMIWADGMNQPEEVAILQRYAIEHLARLAEQNADLMPISVKDTNAFIERFTQSEPSRQMLDELSQLCAERLACHADPVYSRNQSEGLIDFCIDIAAACAATYPFEYDERIITAEKAALRQLMVQFQ